MNQYFNESVCQVSDKIMEKSKKKKLQKKPQTNKQKKKNKTKQREGGKHSWLGKHFFSKKNILLIMRNYCLKKMLRVLY